MLPNGDTRRSSLLSALTILSLSSAFADRILCNVKSVYDGDTIRCVGMKDSIRFLGVDAPEVQPPPGTRAKNLVDKQQPFAYDARDFLRNIISASGNVVSLECGYGVTHDRPVCLVFVEYRDRSFDVGSMLIQSGYAYAELQYIPITKNNLATQYWYAENEAKKNHLGVWSKPYTLETPSEYRKRLRKKAQQ